MNAVQVFSNEIPYFEVQSEIEVLLKYAIPGITPTRPRGYNEVRDTHWNVIEQCWLKDPRARPLSKALSRLFDNELPSVPALTP